MGWLGWEPQLALSTEAVFIEAALSTRADLIEMVFGNGKPKKGAQGKVGAADFRAFANRVNRRLASDG